MKIKNVEDRESRLAALSLHPRSRDQHLRSPGPPQPVDPQMLPPVAAPVDPEPVHGPLRLLLRLRLRLPLSRRRSRRRWRADDQPRRQIRLGPCITQRLVREQGAQVQEADHVREGADVVRQVPLAAGPDDQKRKGVEPAEGHEGVVCGEEGRHADLVAGGVVQGLEDAAGEDGDGQGCDAHEGGPGDLVVSGGEGAEGGLEGQAGRVAQEQAALGGGAVRGGHVGEGLDGAEVDVDGLPGEEEHGADQRRDEAEDEVGGREAVSRGERGETGQESALDPLAREADHHESDEEDENDHDPCRDGAVPEEPDGPPVSGEWRVESPLERLIYQRPLLLQVERVCIRDVGLLLLCHGLLRGWIPHGRALLANPVEYVRLIRHPPVAQPQRPRGHDIAHVRRRLGALKVVQDVRSLDQRDQVGQGDRIPH